MRVTVRMVGGRSRRLPAGREETPCRFDVADGATAEQVLDLLDLPRDHDYAVILNGRIVPEAKRRAARLAEDDALTILPKPKVG